MLVLADNGGFVLAEEGSRLLFFERRILPTWLPFVAGVMTVIGAGNAVIQFLVGSAVAGLVILAVSALCGLGLRAALASRRQTRAEPLQATDALVVLDLQGRTLLDGRGQVLAPLEHVRVEKAMQVTSSSRALKVVWPGGACVVYRGDPFVRTGSIDVPAQALAQRGVST